MQWQAVAGHSAAQWAAGKLQKDTQKAGKEWFPLLLPGNAGFIQYRRSYPGPP